MSAGLCNCRYNMRVSVRVCRCVCVSLCVCLCVVRVTVCVCVCCQKVTQRTLSQLLTRLLARPLTRAYAVLTRRLCTGLQNNSQVAKIIVLTNVFPGDPTRIIVRHARAYLPLRASDCLRENLRGPYANLRHKHLSIAKSMEIKGLLTRTLTRALRGLTPTEFQ